MLAHYRETLKIFRLVQLDKLRLDTRKEEGRLQAERGGVDPQIIIKKPSCNKGGVPEKLIMVMLDSSRDTSSSE